MKKILIIICVFAFGALPACSIHKLDVQQGNVITPEMVATLEPGMDRERIRYLLGSPPISDSFHAKRWDYTYTYREGDQQTETSHLILIFNDQGKLVTIDQSGYIPPKERSGKNN